MKTPKRRGSKSPSMGARKSPSMSARKAPKAAKKVKGHQKGQPNGKKAKTPRKGKKGAPSPRLSAVKSPRSPRSPRNLQKGKKSPNGLRSKSPRTPSKGSEKKRKSNVHGRHVPREIPHLDLNGSAQAESCTVGGRLMRRPPAISTDNKVIFCASGNNVKLFSRLTGEQLRTLHGHTKRVTFVELNPYNAQQLYTASLDGTIRLWNHVEGACVYQWSVGTPIVRAVLSTAVDALEREQIDLQAKETGVPVDQPLRMYLDVDAKYFQKSHREITTVRSHRLAVFNFRNDSFRTLTKTRNCSGLAISPCGLFVAAIAASSIYIWHVPSHKLGKLTHERAITCVAFHPRDPVLATGDSTGQIVLWYRYDLAVPATSPLELSTQSGQHMSKGTEEDSGVVKVTSNLHWHAHAVGTVEFTPDGAYLLSGGEEAVLVIWQLDTTHRHFLPRLGAPIKTIGVSADGKFYAVGCTNNTILIVNAVSTRVERCIYGLQQVPKAGPRVLLKGMSMDPRERLVSLAGTPGHIQLYDVFQDRHVSNLEIIPRNAVSRTNAKHANPTRVELSQYSYTGKYLATIERRTEVEGVPSETSVLKFWMREPKKLSFTVCSKVLEPHQAVVSCMAFHPSKNMLVTGSHDRTFKIWTEVAAAAEPSMTKELRKREGVDVNVERKTWQCSAIGSWHEVPVTAVAFSGDGSILAVAYGQVITLWNPESMSLITTLVHPPPREHLRHLAFVSHTPHAPSATPYIVACSSSAVYVWNVLTLDLEWFVHAHVLDLAVDKDSNRFAVAVESTVTKGEETSRKSFVSVFKPTSREPVLLKETEDFWLQDWHAAMVFVRPKKARRSALVYLNRQRQLTRLDNVGDVQGDDEMDDEAEQERTTTKTDSQRAFESQQTLVPGLQLDEAKAKKAGSIAERLQLPTHKQNSDVLSLLSGPAHVLPAPSALFDSFMDVLLPKASEQQRQPASNSDQPQTQIHAVKEVTPAASPTASKRKRPRQTASESTDVEVPLSWDADGAAYQAMVIDDEPAPTNTNEKINGKPSKLHATPRRRKKPKTKTKATPKAK